MRKVALYSLLLVGGLAGSQVFPGLFGGLYAAARDWIDFGTLTALAFIMIHVGYEFDIDKSNPRKYAWDYVVAATAAAFPWILVTLYFIYAVLPADAGGSWESWRNALLAGRFAAPTSAGVLFSMLAAAGLAGSWLFRRARILAIFDDLDTVLLMIPLKMMVVGLAWQLGVVVLLMVALLWLAWRFLHMWRLPVTWPWVLGYSVVIAGACEMVYVTSKVIDYRVPIHIEVLLPAFVLGCMLRRPEGGHDHHADPAETRATTIISSAFMVLVGLSMPRIRLEGAEGWGLIAWHVLVVTVLSNLGKMFPLFCYRREAHWKERLALCIGMWPRGEVGAGVLVVSLSYGIGGTILTVAMLSLALNLLLTGAFIVAVRRLLASAQEESPPAPGGVTAGS